MRETDAKLSYTVDEAARAIGCSKRKVWDLVKARELETFKFAGRTLIRSDVLQAALDRASGRAAA
jgi:excisionase family DNA binding protein